MTTVEKVAVGVGVAALAGGAWLIYARWRAAGQAAQLSATVPAPFGITSFYSTAGTQIAQSADSSISSAKPGGAYPFVPAAASSLPQPAAASLGWSAALGARAQSPVLDGSQVPSVATILNVPLPTIPLPPTVPSVVVAGPAVETRSGRGHF